MEETRMISAPEDQSVTFVELFFDLVFVFSVTQVVGLLHEGLSWTTVGQAVFVFWLVWWAWSQFTWALNAADTTHSLVQLGTLLATAVAFFMAVAVPDAFHGRSLWFAVTYVLVRGIGLALYAWVAGEDPAQRAAVRTWIVVSLGGLAAVLLGGVLGGQAQVWLWAATILLDLVAAAIGGQLEGWNLHPEHFGERHGLFVIIALGETLIVAAAGVSGAVWSGNLLLVAVVAVALTCTLWWSYFPRAKPLLDEALAAARGREQARLARDSFSLYHFPMAAGIIAYAFVIEELLAHPGDPLPLPARVALGVGLILFVGGMGLALWRALGRVPAVRLGVMGVTAGLVVVLAGVAGPVSLLVALAGVVVVVAYEQRLHAGA